MPIFRVGDIVRYIDEEIARPTDAKRLFVITRLHPANGNRVDMQQVYPTRKRGRYRGTYTDWIEHADPFIAAVWKVRLENVQLP